MIINVSKSGSGVLTKKKSIWTSSKEDKLNLINRIAIYAILIGLGFVYIYPMLYMLSLSFMDKADLVNPTIQWVPNSFTLVNFKEAYRVLHLPQSVFISIYVATMSAVVQTFSGALAAYGLERFDIPFKKFWLILIIMTFIIPSQVTLVPKYLLFHSYHMTNTTLTSFLPAFTGQGLNSAIFILIFYQFFQSCPRALDEAAQIDGAGRLKVFFKITLPMCTPALVVSFLFSFVWYWNETYLSGIFFGDVMETLPMRLESFVEEFSRIYPASNGSELNRLNESIRMAGTFLTILPLVVLYSFMQRQFVEGIEKTGITGE